MTSEARPKLLRGQTLPNYPTLQRETDGNETPRASTSGETTQQISAASMSRDSSRSSSGSDRHRPSFNLNLRDSIQNTTQRNVAHGSISSAPATPMYQYSVQPMYPVPQPSTPVPSSSPYYSPYILKFGGTQQPVIDFSLDATGSYYVLLARLGRGFSSECLTVAARKGNILWIVADRWDRETDSKCEWQIQFDRDADLTSVHANFNDTGLLRLMVKRRS